MASWYFLAFRDLIPMVYNDRLPLRILPLPPGNLSAQDGANPGLLLFIGQVRLMRHPTEGQDDEQDYPGNEVSSTVRRILGDLGWAPRSGPRAKRFCSAWFRFARLFDFVVVQF